MIKNGKLSLSVTPVYQKNAEYLFDNKHRFILNQGGTRSSKTYSICQLILTYIIKKPGTVISIIRKTLPALKSSILRDLKSVLESNLNPSDYEHNKSEGVFTFTNGSTIEYFSADDAQKLRGRKRDLAVLNEGNELSLEDFNQINFRTNDKIIIDYNPSFQKHWILDLKDDKESAFIHSTYKDNPFLEKSLVKEIEKLIETDENYHKIYALGLAPTPKEQIFTHFKKGNFFNKEEILSYSIGLDFGYSHPTACVLIGWKNDKEISLKELIFQSHLTSEDLIPLLKERLKENDIPINTPIYADYARPEMINSLKRAGFNISNADKNVQKGLDTVKTKNIYIPETEINIWNEYYLYSHKKDRNGNIQEEILKTNDDLMDALRYGVVTHKFASNGYRRFRVG